MTSETAPLILPVGGHQEPRPRMRGWLHFYAFGTAIVCGIVLCGVALTRPGWTPFLACVVYSITVCGLFGISALYHRRAWGPRGWALMRRLDHSMIFVFIAGTYTPFCLLLLPERTATVLLTIVWVGASVGVTVKMIWPGAPKWFGVPLYIGLGWAAVGVLPDILAAGGIAAVVLVAAGGLAYSMGALFYALEWPNPWPTTFGHHEFFHACTLAAALCHHIAIYLALFT
ncbi:MAG TPA: hemolysin III family protein [Cryptosporangiaceae bacterium]|nr:hemolysin III family protein [Cryptosporangiaceae bacterium]